jgi:hypothetical protein
VPGYGPTLTYAEVRRVEAAADDAVTDGKGSHSHRHAREELAAGRGLPAGRAGRRWGQYIQSS